MGTVVIRPDLDITLTVGKWVAVSGFWRKNEVLATRQEAIDPQEFAKTQGTYHPDDSSDGQIGESHIYNTTQIALRAGGVTRVIEQETKDRILAQPFQAAPFEALVRIVLTEGYLSVPDADGFYSDLGAGLVSLTQQSEMIDPQTFVTYCGIECPKGD